MSQGDYRVADISLADFGRKEIELAEYEVSQSGGPLIS
jgi:adenosylhomocysteinase